MQLEKQKIKIEHCRHMKRIQLDKEIQYNLTSLPIDVVQTIIEFLSLSEIARLRRSSSFFALRFGLWPKTIMLSILSHHFDFDTTKNIKYERYVISKLKKLFSSVTFLTKLSIETSYWTKSMMEELTHLLRPNIPRLLILSSDRGVKHENDETHPLLCLYPKLTNAVQTGLSLELVSIYVADDKKDQVVIDNLKQYPCTGLVLHSSAPTLIAFETKSFPFLRQLVTNVTVYLFDRFVAALKNYELDRLNLRLNSYTSDLQWKKKSLAPLGDFKVKHLKLRCYVQKMHDEPNKSWLIDDEFMENVATTSVMESLVVMGVGIDLILKDEKERLVQHQTKLKCVSLHSSAVNAPDLSALLHYCSCLEELHLFPAKNAHGYNYPTISNWNDLHDLVLKDVSLPKLTLLSHNFSPDGLDDTTSWNAWPNTCLIATPNSVERLAVSRAQIKEISLNMVFPSTGQWLTQANWSQLKSLHLKSEEWSNQLLMSLCDLKSVYTVKLVGSKYTAEEKTLDLGHVLFNWIDLHTITIQIKHLTADDVLTLSTKKWEYRLRVVRMHIGNYAAASIDMLQALSRWRVEVLDLRLPSCATNGIRWLQVSKMACKVLKIDESGFWPFNDYRYNEEVLDHIQTICDDARSRYDDDNDHPGELV
jgi:hypothetical protein